MRRVLVTSLLVHAILFPALPLFSSDLFSYLAYGELSANGLDMMRVGPAALPGSAFADIAQWQTTPSVYGPVANLLMAAAGHFGAAVGSPVWGAGIAYKLIVGALDLLGVLLIYLILRKKGRAADVQSLALFGLNPLLAWEVMSQAHNDGLIVAGAVGYLAAVSYRREVLGVMSLTLATLAKFLLAPVLALHLWATVRNNFGRALTLGLIALLTTVAACAPFWSEDATLSTWIPLLRPGIYEEYAATYSIFALLRKSIPAMAPDGYLLAASYEIWKWFGRLVVLAILVLVLIRVRTARDVAPASLLVLLGVLATAFAFHPWYVTWLLPFAAVVDDRRWQRLVLGMSVVAAPSVGIPLLWIVLPVAQLAALIALAAWAKDGWPTNDDAT